MWSFLHENNNNIRTLDGIWWVRRRKRYWILMILLFSLAAKVKRVIYASNSGSIQICFVINEWKNKWKKWRQKAIASQIHSVFFCVQLNTLSEASFIILFNIFNCIYVLHLIAQTINNWNLVHTKSRDHNVIETSKTFSNVCVPCELLLVLICQCCFY